MPINTKNIVLKYKFLIVLLVSNQALSQPTEGVGEGYVVLCHEEQATGFNWENNKWVRKWYLESFMTKDQVITSRDILVA
jgi:hypothetical protein